MYTRWPHFEVDLTTNLPCLLVQVKCDGLDEAMSVVCLQDDLRPLVAWNLCVAEVISNLKDTPHMREALPGWTRFWAVVNGLDKMTIIYMNWSVQIKSMRLFLTHEE